MAKKSGGTKVIGGTKSGGMKKARAFGGTMAKTSNCYKK